VTRITIQDGRLVLRDGKVGTEQACCCGEDPCIPGCECLSVSACGWGTSGNDLSDEENQALADAWLAYTLGWVNANNILQRIRDAGYERVLIVDNEADAIPTGWSASVNISYNCCGIVDEQDEPIVIYDDATANQPWDLPAEIGGLGGGICPSPTGEPGGLILFPCVPNPLP
jgi:hypothetical protein